MHFPRCCQFPLFSLSFSYPQLRCFSRRSPSSDLGLPSFRHDSQPRYIQWMHVCTVCFTRPLRSAPNSLTWHYCFLSNILKYFMYLQARAWNALRSVKSRLSLLESNIWMQLINTLALLSAFFLAHEWWTVKLITIFPLNTSRMDLVNWGCLICLLQSTLRAESWNICIFSADETNNLQKSGKVLKELTAVAQDAIQSNRCTGPKSIVYYGYNTRV